LYFSASVEWRAWPEDDHATAKEAWLLFYHQETGRLALDYEVAVEYALHHLDCHGQAPGNPAGANERVAGNAGPR